MLIITEAICDDLLEKLLSVNRTQYKILGINLTNISSESKGFLGEHLHLNIKIFWNKLNQQESYKLFVKSIPALHEWKSYIQNIGVFEKELQFYSQIDKLTRYSSLPWSPKCYHIIDNRALIMEDLELKKYHTANHREFFELKYVEEMVKTLAIFHASSLIYDQLHGNIAKDFGNIVAECGYISDSKSIRGKWLRSNCNAFLCLIKLLPNYDLDHSQKLEKMLYLIPEYIKPSKTIPNVINHGDLWCNNIMFHSETHRAILIDFQFCRLAIPTHDLFVALYTTTSFDFREKHLPYILDMYYQTFSKELDINGLASTVFPLKTFQESCKVSEIYGLLDASLQTMLIYYRPEDIDPIFQDTVLIQNFQYGDKNSFVANVFQNDAVFRDRVQNVYNNLLHLIK